MGNNFIVIDNYLGDFDSFRLHCDGLSYDGEINPEDGIFYPGVSLDIPDKIKDEVLSKLEITLDRKVAPSQMFLRKSELGVNAPHQAHTDSVMSEFSMMLYMNRMEHCIGGTSLLVHNETGLCDNPINHTQYETWKKDANNPNAWSRLDMCTMFPNRAVIFRSEKMHRAEPVGGFGCDSTDSRLVLTLFFSLL